MINFKVKERFLIPMWIFIVLFLSTFNSSVLNGMESLLAVSTPNVTTEASINFETCEDGIQNGDETGIDCGGSICTPCQTPSVVDCNPLYFVDNSASEISSLLKDGTGLTSLIKSEFLDPTLVAAHLGLGYLFIFDNGDKSIKRASLNGANLTTIVASGLSNLGGLTVNESENKIYWSDWSRGEIKRSNLDGSNVESVITGLNDPGEIVFESMSNNLFWVDGTNGEIWKSDVSLGSTELLVSGLSDPNGIDIDEINEYIYFSDAQTGRLHRVEMDGTGLITLGTIGLISPGSLVVDEDSGKIYGTEWGQYKVFQMNVNGTGFKSLVTNGTSLPNSILLDKSNNDLIWVDQGNAALQRANLNGSGLSNILSSLTSFGLVSILVDHKLYWTNLSAGTVNSSDLDGGNSMVLVNGLTTPKGIGWHGGLQKLFWVDSGTRKLQSANLDGSELTDVLTTDMKIPNGVFIDEVNNYVYWTDIGNKTIERVKPDGTERETVIDEGLVIPEVIVVDPFEEYIYWSDVGNSKIKRSDLDGNGIITLVANNLGLVKGLYLDKFYDKLYWTDAAKDRIEKICTNGEGRNIVFELPKGSYPTGISSTDSICLEIIPGDTSNCKLLSDIFIGDDNNMDWIKLGDEDDKIAAFINAQGNNLGHVTSKIYLDSNDVRYVEGIPYARRDIEIIPEVDPTTPVLIRLFYFNDEIDDLLSVDEGITSLEDLVIARDDEGCTGTYAGQGTILPPTKTREYGENHFYFQVSSEFLGSFYLYGVGGSLATEWTHVAAQTVDEGIELNWISNSTRDVTGFEIQRSVDGLDFQYLSNLSNVDHFGEAVSYAFMDKAPIIGNNYYRIVEQTKNGNGNISKIVSSHWSNKTNFQVFPNPASGLITIRSIKETEIRGKVFITDLLGRELIQTDMSNTELEISLHSFENGIYLLRIQNGKELLHTQKIIISHK